MLVSFPLAFIVIRSIKESNYEDENVRICSRLGALLCFELRLIWVHVDGIRG